jgi:CubicO group peptidase (beta-lactamase class C family)
MKSSIVLLYPLIFLLTLCSSCKEQSVEPSPFSVAMEDAFSLAAQNSNLDCLIVYQNDHMVKEKYFHPGDSLSLHDVRSVTKSIMATLIGIAIDTGYIPSEDQKIGGYVQPLVGTLDSTKANLKISHLLTMSAGLTGNELTDLTEYSSWHNAPDQISYTLDKPMTSLPGQVFTYNSGVTHLLSAILTRASGMSTFEFGKRYLFQPLGIADPHWETDKRDFENGAAGLSLTPYDMLKIGQLYLNKGVYNGTRIVSEKWITKAASFKITTNNALPFGPDYGYCWWIGNIHSHDYFFANGWGGQFIVVVPDLRLIVIATNTWSGVSTSTANEQWYNTLDLIMNKIIPLY